MFVVRQMTFEDAEAAAQLQSLAFPPPFPQELLWDAEHLRRHLELFPAGQFVAEAEGRLVGSCSNTLISEEGWQAHGGWDETVGGPFLRNFDPEGSTMYGLDITVHPEFRRLGIGRQFYESRFGLTGTLDLARYGTACRLPGYAEHPTLSVQAYASEVVAGRIVDRTLTPLLRYGLSFLGVIENYMRDKESGNAAALLEWRP